MMVLVVVVVVVAGKKTILVLCYIIRHKCRNTPTFFVVVAPTTSWHNRVSFPSPSISSVSVCLSIHRVPIFPYRTMLCTSHDGVCVYLPWSCGHHASFFGSQFFDLAFEMFVAVFRSILVCFLLNMEFRAVILLLLRLLLCFLRCCGLVWFDRRYRIIRCDRNKFGYAILLTIPGTSICSGGVFGLLHHRRYNHDHRSRHRRFSSSSSSFLLWVLLHFILSFLLLGSAATQLSCPSLSLSLSLGRSVGRSLYFFLP